MTLRAKTFISTFLIIAALTNAAWAVATGDRWCNNYMCVAISLADDGTANVQVQGSPNVGWLAFGVGTSMLTGDLTVMWPNSDGTFTTSRRKASSYTMPQIVANQTALKLDPSDTGVKSGKLQIAITRPQVLAESSITSQQTAFLWAFSSSKPSGKSFDATLQQHDASGPFRLDLTKPLTATTNGTNSTNTTGQTQDFASSKTELSAYDKMVIAHAVVMCVAWCILTPLAIFIARFGRNLSRWVRIHYSIQIFGTGSLVIVGFVLGYIQSSGSHLKTNHQIIGVAIFIATFLQIFLGYIIHHLYDPNRTHRPIRNWVHRFLGPLILILSFVQIPLGLTDYNAPWPTFIAYYVWLGVLGLIFIILTIRQFWIERNTVKSEMS